MKSEDVTGTTPTCETCKGMGRAPVWTGWVYDVRPCPDCEGLGRVEITKAGTPRT